jgi:arylsulfate sulfotransferase
MQKLLFVCTVTILVTFSCKKSDLVPFLPPIDIPIKSISVVINPTGYVPLSALVKFSSPLTGKTSIKVEGKHGPQSDIEHTFNDYGAHHSVPIIGLYSNYLNTVHLNLVNSDGHTIARTTLKIRIDSLPDILQTAIKADVLPNGNVAKGVFLVSNYSVLNPQIPLMVDNYGDIRWFLDYSNHPELKTLRYNNGLKRLRNGNFYFGNTSTHKIYEIDLLGTVLNTWDLGSKGFLFHHEIEEKPDGNLIALASKTGSLNYGSNETIEDFVLEINRKTGNIVTVWDLKESMDEYRLAITPHPEDWMHANAVLYDSTDNTIVVSGRHQGVIKVDFNNKLKWIIAPHRGWTTNRRGEDLKRFLLTPLAADGKAITDSAVLDGSKNHRDFEWLWYQHSTVATPNGNYMFFDNGDIRNYVEEAAKYSRAVEYKIDPVKMTIQQKWQYGKERGLETFSRIVSSVQYLPKSNHVLFCPGTWVQNENGVGGKVVEVDYKTKRVAVQLSFSAVNTWGFHKTLKMSAYPE